jgi:hypothetical protein
MTKQEQLLIKQLIEDLKRSRTTSWTTGNFDQWADFAKTMRASIDHTIRTLLTLTSSDFQEETPSKAHEAVK